MGMERWVVRLLDREDLSDDALEAFDRFQRTERIWFREGEGHVLRDSCFTDDWDDKTKRELVGALRAGIEKGGRVAGAFKDGVLLGFASVAPDFFGKDGSYLQLENLHMSREARLQGVGKRLFGLICAEARKMGARKLYISAHSSAETQRFYQAVGCVYAKETHPVLVAKEPYDIQLEFDLER